MKTSITELNDTHRGWLYHSGTTAYVERFREGRLIFASFQDTGIPWNPRDEQIDAFSFDLQIDGESLYFGWELDESTIRQNEKGLAESYLKLRHPLKQVVMEITTLAGGFGFLRRRMRLTNAGKTSIGLTSVTPLCGTLWGIPDDFKENLADSGTQAYRVGWMQDQDWGAEGNFQWQDIPLNSELSFGSKCGRSGFSAPFAIAHNNIYGGYFVAALAWSANWKMSYFTKYHCGGATNLQFAMMPLAPAPMRLIAAGETIDLPEVHFGLNHENFNSSVQSWHNHLRQNVLIRNSDDRQPVIYNHWSYLEHELSEKSLFQEIDIAAEIGAELFMVDAGWYADANTAWYDTSGDWEAGDRLPNDLFPIFDHIRSKGMLCGLWLEVESAGKLSKLTKEHPDWFISRYGNPVDRILDLSKPEVAEFVEGHIFRVIERYKLDMFRLDYNLDQREGGFNLHEGKMENTLYRHMEVIYDIFERVRKKHPNLQLENCASGGGRCDLGMVSRFTTTWVSDWLRMPRAIRILNGMSMAIPPEHINRTFGVSMRGNYRGNLETQLHGIILAHPAVSGISLKPDGKNPEVMDVVKKYLSIYKDFIRPFHRNAKIYHHTPVIAGGDGSGWCVLEHVAADQAKAVACIFRLINVKEDTFPFIFRGLDPAKNYRLTFEPGGKTAVKDGFSLCNEGIVVRLDTALTSTMICCEAV